MSEQQKSTRVFTKSTRFNTLKSGARVMNLTLTRDEALKLAEMIDSTPGEKLQIALYTEERQAGNGDVFDSTNIQVTEAFSKGQGQGGGGSRFVPKSYGNKGGSSSNRNAQAVNDRANRVRREIGE